MPHATILDELYDLDFLICSEFSVVFYDFFQVTTILDIRGYLVRFMIRCFLFLAEAIY